MIYSIQKILLIIGLLLLKPVISFAYDFWPWNFWSDYSGLESWNFLSWDYWLDLYNKIDSGYTSLQIKLLSDAAKWWEEDWSIAKTYNLEYFKSWLKECINENTFTYSDHLNIREWKLEWFEKKLKEECKNTDWSINIITVNNLKKISNKVDISLQKKANEAAESMAEIARIWLYSDWNTDNSPFDLIDDLKKIDEIIFTQEIPYEWVNEEDSDNKLSDLIWITSSDANNIIQNWTASNNNNWTSINPNYDDPTTPYPVSLADILSSNPWICDNNNSGLWANSIQSLWIWWDLLDCSEEWIRLTSHCCENLELYKVNWNDFCYDKTKWNSIKCIYTNNEQEWYYYMK